MKHSVLTAAEAIDVGHAYRMFHLEDQAALRGGDPDVTEAANDALARLGIHGVMLLAADGTILDVESNSMAKLALGRPWECCWPRDARPAIRAAIAEARTGRTLQFTQHGASVDGVDKWWEVVLTPVGDGGRLVAVRRDLSRERAAIDHARWSANHDLLTGLPGRALFMERLAEVTASADRAALMVLDVDHFKEINDGLGHDAGDAILREFAARVRSGLGMNAFVARLGGDEFAALITDPEPDVLQSAEDLLMQLCEPYLHAGRTIDASASIGICLLPDQADQPDRAFKLADLALYAAKDAGRNGYAMFAPHMLEAAERHDAMLALARRALATDAVVPVYQPQVALETGRITGFEALLRWRDEAGNLQPPAALAAAFAEPRLGAKLGEAMIGKVLHDMCRWRDAGLDFGRVAINVGAPDLQRPLFAERLLDRLARAGLTPAMLEVEVTESVIMSGIGDCVQRALATLHHAGVRIALDDFGTGYASLTHLKQYPVDVIKIDRSFVDTLAGDPDAGAIVRAVINLGENLAMSVVAEGVEGARQADLLRQSGCSHAQGYLFGMPAPYAPTTRLLERDAAIASAAAMQP